MQITARQIADLLNGTVTGNEDVIVTGASKIEEGLPGTISFLANPKYAEYIYSTLASVVLVDKSFHSDNNINATLIFVENVYAALAVLMEKFNSGITLDQGIAASAIVHSSAILGQGVSIDDHVIIKPNVKIGNNTRIFGQVFIGDNATIGDNVTIYPGVKVYHNCIIGNNCVIHSNTVIGSDGFGFAKDEDGQYKKIPQTGNVVLEDNVEIGSNTVIDRASLGSTIIKKGVKLDNLIQIAHNVTVGANTAIAAQSGVAGSTRIGEQCLIGGQVGIVGHIQIANGTMIQAQSGIPSSVKGPNARLYGSPAIDYQQYLKAYAIFRRLPEMANQLRTIELTLKKLEKNNL